MLGCANMFVNYVQERFSGQFQAENNLRYLRRNAFQVLRTVRGDVVKRVRWRSQSYEWVYVNQIVEMILLGEPLPEKNDTFYHHKCSGISTSCLIGLLLIA